MGVGKYSPTVSNSYRRDQNWWKRNGGGYDNGKYPDKDVDDDGYDSYGYSGDCGDGEDRAGYGEDQYMVGEPLGFDDYHYPLYDQVALEWDDVLLGDLNKSG